MSRVHWPAIPLKAHEEKPTQSSGSSSGFRGFESLPPHFFILILECFACFQGFFRCLEGFRVVFGSHLLLNSTLTATELLDAMRAFDGHTVGVFSAAKAQKRSS